MTEAEERLWFHLRNRKLGGYKFRRQVTITPFIVDFLCIERKLVIEADGSQHGEEVDAKRTAFLQRQGYLVIRFWNSEIFENLDGVLSGILAALQA